MSRTTQFPCPACGYAYSRATSTTKARSGVDVRRHRTCERSTCRAGFVTYEIKASDYEFLRAARRFMENHRDEEADQEKAGDGLSVPPLRRQHARPENERGLSTEDHGARPRPA